MLIDWFTVGAQALNFLILVWVLKHFLYKPILNAIDAREKKIAAELADAAAKKAEAQKDRDEFQHKNEEFDEQRAALLSKATDEAKAEGHRLLDEARKAADALSAKRQERLKNDAHNLNQAIARRTQQEVFSIARKTLTDLATTSLEERMGEVFTRRLREMDGKAKEPLGAALKSAPEPAVVRSAFDLPANQRAAIQNAVNETFSADIHLRFETTPDLVSGIELTANGQKVAWSIADYLASLGKGVGELLKEQDKPEPKPAPKPEAKPEPRPAAKAEPSTEAKAAPKPEAKPEPKPEAAPPAESKPRAKPEPKPAAKAEPSTEAKAAPKPETKPEPKAEAEAKAKPKPESAAKAEPKVQEETSSAAPAEPKPKAKATAKPGAEAPVAPEPGTEAKADTPAPDATPQAATKTEPKAQTEPKPAVESAPKPEAAAKAGPKPNEPKAVPASS
jgi:F-type H+-transporting ATPase subunit b